MQDSDRVIRRALPEDSENLLPLVQGLAAHHGDDCLADEASLRRDMHSVAVVLMAHRAEVPLGYAAMLPLAQMQFGWRGWDIHHLFVDAGSRGGGIGRALVEACRHFAREDAAQYLMIGTHPDNLAAQSTYRAWGFEERPQGGPRFRMQVR